MRALAVAVVVTAMMTLSAPKAEAVPVTFDFEGLTDLSELGAQLGGPLGISFTNAVVLTAGASLNEFDFPPQSGIQVVADVLGPLTMSFGSTITSFSGFFTYTEQLTLTALFQGAVVGQILSAPGSNVATFGGTPNEFLTLSGFNFDTLLVTGNAAGGSFTLDVATADFVENVPEPSTLSLAGIGILSLWRYRRSKKA
jgi:hypothetical protein